MSSLRQSRRCQDAVTASVQSSNALGILDFGKAVMRAEAKAVLHVTSRLDESFEAAVRLMGACEGAVIVSGIGKSGIIAQKISATLASTGTTSHFMHPTDAMHGDLGRVREGDVALLLSYSGQTDEILSLASALWQDNVPIIAVVGHEESSLAKLATVRLCLGNVKEACPFNLAPTASTAVMLALGDALSLAVSRRHAFSVDDFRRRHPGGLLGRKMLPVREVLRFRAGSNLPLLREDRTVAAVLSEASEFSRRPGAVLLVDPSGKLSGMFTDADLRRLLLREGPRALEIPVRDVMTPQPLTLLESDRVLDAMRLVCEKRVDEIPVVNSEREPVGLLDVQDLLALRVLVDSDVDHRSPGECAQHPGRLTQLAASSPG